MKGISTILAFIVLIAITFSIAAMMNPWLFRAINDETDYIGNESETNIVCRNVQYSLVRGYGSEGIHMSLCEAPRYIRAKIKNYGSTNLYGFSFTLVYNESEIIIPVTQESQITESNPMRPGDEIIIEGVPEDCLEVPNEIKITNSLGCPPVVYSL